MTTTKRVMFAAAAAGEPACAIKRLCGNCPHVNDVYQKALEQKHEAAMQVIEQAGLLQYTRLLGVTPAPHPLRYRSHFKLAVRALPVWRGSQPSNESNRKRVAIGLFQPGSHRVTDLTDCPLHTDPLYHLIGACKEFLTHSTLDGFNEDTQKGDLRYIVARASHLTGDLMITFVVTGPTCKPELLRLVQNLRRQGLKVVSAYMHVHRGEGNAIFAGETSHIFGQEQLRERFCELDVDVGPESFLQINPWTATQVYRRVEQLVGRASPGETAWDLYCGVGVFAMLLARAGFAVQGIEENPEAVKLASHNGQKNDLTKNLQFTAGRSEDVLNELHDTPSVIVVNPSRRGLDTKVREQIAQACKGKKTRLFYVSCDIGSLTRDLADLKSQGLLLRQLEAFDMFPQTQHLEWLAVLTN